MQWLGFIIVVLLATLVFSCGIVVRKSENGARRNGVLGDVWVFEIECTFCVAFWDNSRWLCGTSDTQLHVAADGIDRACMALYVWGRLHQNSCVKLTMFMLPMSWRCAATRRKQSHLPWINRNPKESGECNLRVCAVYVARYIHTPQIV